MIRLEAEFDSLKKYEHENLIKKPIAFFFGEVHFSNWQHWRMEVEMHSRFRQFFSEYGHVRMKYLSLVDSRALSRMLDVSIDNGKLKQ